MISEGAISFLEKGNDHVIVYRREKNYDGASERAGDNLILKPYEIVALYHR